MWAVTRLLVDVPPGCPGSATPTRPRPTPAPARPSYRCRRRWWQGARGQPPRGATGHRPRWHAPAAVVAHAGADRLPRRPLRLASAEAAHRPPLLAGLDG